MSTKNRKKIEAPAKASSLFVINQCDIQFKGKPLKLGGHIDEWVKVIAPYDRNIARIYVWDEFGVQVWGRGGWGTGEKGKETISLNFIFNIDESGFNNKDELRWAKTKAERVKIRRRMSKNPNPLFKGSFLLDGVVMTEDIDFYKIAQQRSEYHRKHYDWKPGQEIKTFNESYIPSRWAYNINCPDGQNYGFIASLMSNDYSKMEAFTIGN